MWLRANVVLAVAVVLAVVQMFASATGGPRIGDSWALAGVPDRGLGQSVAAQEEDEDDNDDEDNEDDDSDNDEDDSDNDEDDSDNDEDDSDNDEDDSDNDEDDSDNDEEDSDNDDADDSDNDEEDADADNEDVEDEADADNDEVDAEDVDAEADNAVDDDAEAPEADNGGDDTAAADSFPIGPPAQNSSASPPSPRGTAASPSPSPSPAPVMEVQGVTTGADMLLALPGDRVAVQVFASTPPDITLKLRLVDPLAYPATPGIRAGDLIFQVEALDASGVPLTTLPAEVSLSVRYTNPEVVGLDEAAIILSRLDPVDQQWKTAPNLLVDPITNSVMASTVDTGVYAVHVP